MPEPAEPNDHADAPGDSRLLVAAIVRCRGAARRALIAYVIAGVLLLGQQPYRRMSMERYADDSDLRGQAVQLSLALDAVMIGFLVVGGLSAAVALRRYADLKLARRPPCCCRPNSAWIKVTKVAAWVLALVVLVAAGLDALEDILLTVEGGGALSNGLTIWVQVLGVAAALSALIASLVAWSAQAAAAQSLPIRAGDPPPGLGVRPTASATRKSWRAKVWEFLLRMVPTSWRRKPRGCSCGGVAEPAIHAEEVNRSRQPGTVIACSGGGMRSASFTLGALQAFQEKGELNRTTPIYAVSGGSYMASSFASLWESNKASNLARPDDKVFAEGSAEEHRLRNNTRYLAPSARQIIWGAITLLWGIAVNLALAAMLLRLLTLVVAGWLREFDVLELLSTATPVTDMPDWGEGGWRSHLLWAAPLAVAGASILLYFGADIVSRPRPWRQSIKVWARASLLTGLAGLLLFIVVPEASTALARLSHENNPTVAVASIIDGFGFPTPDGCEAALRESFEKAVKESVRADDSAGREFGACGATGTAYPTDEAMDLGIDELKERVEGGYFDEGGFSTQLASLVALITLIGAMARGAAGKSAPKDAATAERKKLGVFSRRPSVGFRDKLRHTLLPWLATLLVVLIAFVALLRWTRDLAIAKPEAAVHQIQVWIPVGILLLVCLVTNANRSTMHTFYREQIASAFAVHFVRGKQGIPANSDAVEPRPYKDLWPLSSLSEARPKINLTICAAASCSEPGVVPPGRECTSFVFSREFIGMTDQRLPGGAASSQPGAPSPRNARTADYETFSPRAATVPAAVAISGAAISPITGRMATFKPYRLLLAMANIRLGVWLRNPALFDPKKPPPRGLRRGLNSPGVWWVFREAAGRTQINDQWLYVTDGGHYENLGLVEALRKRPRRVFVLDASGDQEDEFATLGVAIATARMDLGVEIKICPEHMKVGAEGYAQRSAICAQATWPDRTEPTHIIYGRLILTPKLPWDAKSYAMEHPEFPHLGTQQQLYGEFDFEAYRVLGREVGERMMGMTSPDANHVEAPCPSGPTAQSPS